jgi:hypothetical protein
MNRTVASLVSGAIGALTLTAVHEAGRRRLPYAPRMDVLGMRALRRLPAFEHERPRSARLQRWALAGDLVANSLYYAAVPAASSASTWARAAALGVAAGVGALALPERMGLGEAPNSQRWANQAMTVAWYVAGALATAAAANGMRYGRLPK